MLLETKTSRCEDHLTQFFLFFVSCNSLKTKIPTVLQWRRALGEGNKQRNNDVKMQYSNCNYIELPIVLYAFGVVRGRQSRQNRQGSSRVVRVVRVVRGRQGSSESSESSGVVRGRQSRQESSGVVRGRQSRQSRQESSWVVRVVRSRQLWIVRVVRSRHSKFDNHRNHHWVCQKLWAMDVSSLWMRCIPTQKNWWLEGSEQAAAPEVVCFGPKASLQRSLL